MAATSSTVPAVKSALVSLLTSAISDSTVQVVYGRPQDSLVKAQFVHVADVDYSAEIANIKAGRKQYDENYTVDVVFAVGKPRATSVDTEARAFALFEYLRDLLADDPSLGGVDGVVWAVLESVDAATEHQGNVVVSVIVATVRVRARVE
jgi:hypothetical protein